MCLLEFEYAKRLKAHSQTFPDLHYLWDDFLETHHCDTDLEHLVINEMDHFAMRYACKQITVVTLSEKYSVESFYVNWTIVG